MPPSERQQDSLLELLQERDAPPEPELAAWGMESAANAGRQKDLRARKDLLAAAAAICEESAGTVGA